MSYIAGMHLKDFLCATSISSDAELTGQDVMTPATDDGPVFLRSDFAMLYNNMHLSLYQDTSFPYQGNVTNILRLGTQRDRPALFFDPLRTDGDGAHFNSPQTRPSAMVGTVKVPTLRGFDSQAMRVIIAYFPRSASAVSVKLPDDL